MADMNATPPLALPELLLIPSPGKGKGLDMELATPSRRKPTW